MLPTQKGVFKMKKPIILIFLILLLWSGIIKAENPVTVLIPAGYSASFQIGRESALGQGAEIVLTLAKSGGIYQKFFLAANPTPEGAKQIIAQNDTLEASITGFYHFHEQGYKKSPDGKILSTTNGGRTIIVGFEDNGKNDNGQRDGDYNDCTVTINLYPTK